MDKQHKLQTAGDVILYRDSTSVVAPLFTRYEKIHSLHIPLQHSERNLRLPAHVS